MTTTTETARPVASRPLYLRLWATVPREALYLLVTFPIAVVVFGVTIGLFSAAAGTIVTFFLGVFFLIGALYVSRGAGTVDRALLEFAGRPRIPAPDWRDDTARTGFLGWLKSLFGNIHYWLHLVWAMIVNFVVSTVSFTLIVTWIAVALGGLTSWIWLPFVPFEGRGFILSQWLAERVFRLGPVIDVVAAEIVLQFVLGIVFAALLPFVSRGLTLVHWGVARGLLAGFGDADLARRVETLTESRSAAVAAEGTALRRLERDIHDGPQQRLVRLQMDLAAAERQLATDPDSARKLLDEARQQSKEALEELRALSRGFAPPILLDRGLVAALESLAIRSAVTVRVASTLPPELELPTELSRNAYFIAAEAVTNAVKHAGASAIDVRLDLRRVPETDDTWLDITVADDGRGGAAIRPEHGLAGLVERTRGLGGTLEISSPEGGPTLIAARLPVAVGGRADSAPPSTLEG